MRLHVIVNMIHIPCPFCGKTCIRRGTAQDIVGATLDCEHCNVLLVIKEWRGTISVFSFHEWMNSLNASWPTDGNGTGFIDIVVEE